MHSISVSGTSFRAHDFRETFSPRATNPDSGYFWAWARGSLQIGPFPVRGRFAADVGVGGVRGMDFATACHWQGARRPRFHWNCDGGGLGGINRMDLLDVMVWPGRNGWLREVARVYSRPLSVFIYSSCGARGPDGGGGTAVPAQRQQSAPSQTDGDIAGNTSAGAEVLSTSSPFSEFRLTPPWAVPVTV